MEKETGRSFCRRSQGRMWIVASLVLAAVLVGLLAGLVEFGQVGHGFHHPDDVAFLVPDNAGVFDD